MSLVKARKEKLLFYRKLLKYDSMPLFEQAAFWRAAHSLKDLPDPTLPEIAFAGRSNAGKSSAINALARRRRLAFTSKTPGRTREIVFFTIPGRGYLVDLPGYGYAKVPAAMRAHWDQTLGSYLQTRPSLCGLALIMDIRHPLTELDQRMLDWFAPTGRPILVLLTKSDKLTRTQAERTLDEVSRALAAWGPQCRVLLFSSVDRTGIESAEAQFSSWLAASSADAGVHVGSAIEPAPETTRRRTARPASQAQKTRSNSGKTRTAKGISGPKRKSPGPKGKVRGQTP